MKRILVFIVLFVSLLFSPSIAAQFHIEAAGLNIYEIFANHGSVMVLIDSESGDIIHVDFYGYTIEQLESMQIHDINTLSTAETKKEMQAAALEKRNYFIFKHRLANGEIRTVEVYSCPHEYHGRTILCSIINDITAKTQLAERKRHITQAFFLVLAIAVITVAAVSLVLFKSNKKLRAQTQKIKNYNELRQTFIDADHSLIYLKDENLKYVFVNKAIEAFYNKEAKDIIGCDDFAVTAEGFAVWNRKSDLEVLTKKTTFVGEMHWEGRVFHTTKFPVKLINNSYGVGAYIREITEEYNTKKEIIYLSYHDTLTGLYNRRFFEEELSRLDIKENLPLSIIMGDVNGLKMANDVFGHDAGDRLLQRAAEILKKGCRNEDIIARMGGDEFVIILPNTTKEEAASIARRTKELFAQEDFWAIEGSLSLGFATKNTEDEDISQVIKNAEECMYTEKTLESKNINITALKALVKRLQANSPWEGVHAQRVSSLCHALGKALNLPEAEIRRLREAGFLHDIGKIVFEVSLLNKRGELTEQEQQEIKKHPVVGYRLLNHSEDTIELAKYVLYHHERWDGTGYPKGLRGENIPRESRIIALAESYDAMTNPFTYQERLSQQEALLEIEKKAGSQFDPELARIFVEMLRKGEQAE